MGHALVHRGGFENPNELEHVLASFSPNNICEVTAEEMQRMHCNVFSISPDTVVSDLRFSRTNAQMRQWGYTVIEVDLKETSKMGGLLRCTTLPLRRTPKS
jgi:N-dimethylarginine dimethylaminohydrolase